MVYHFVAAPLLGGAWRPECNAALDVAEGDDSASALAASAPRQQLPSPGYTRSGSTGVF